MFRVGLKIYFDGGCRPNPGTMETAVVVRGKAHFDTAPGHGTSAEAEWLALLHALEIAVMLAADDVILLGDSRMVIDQASGNTTCGARFLPYLDRYRQAASCLARRRLRHIPRTQNLAGIALDMRRWR